MKCWVYRGRRQPEAYLFVLHRDDFSAVPQPLLKQLGTLELALEFELIPGRRLARSDPDTVRAALADRGFFLQPPPPKEHRLRED